MINNIIDKIKNDKKNLLKILLSFFATLGVIGIYKIFITNHSINNTFVTTIIFFIFLIAYLKIPDLKKNEKVFSILFSFIVSIILVLGTQLEFFSEILWTLSTIFKILFLIFSIFPLCCFLIFFINSFKLKELKNINYKRLILITFIIIFFFNFLVFLAMYPGMYGYDAGFQIMQILDSSTPLTSHFSLLYSAILAYIVKLGKILFDSYQAGFAIYCLLQMTFLCYVSTKITIFCIKRTQNIYIYILSIIFFSIFPLYTVMTLSAAQDTIFAGIFCLIVLNLVDLYEDKNYWKTKYKPILLSILLLLLCLIRNNGFYCILVSIPFILFLNKNKKLLTLLLFIIPLCVYKIYTGPIMDYMKVTKGDSIREMASIPSQQLARVYNYNKEVFNEDELKRLNTYYNEIEDFKYYTYRQSIADPTKSVLNNNVVKENIIDYGKLWVSIGIKDPENYIEAFLLNTLGYWYPNKNYKDDRMYHPYIEYEMLDAQKWNPKYLDIKRESKFPLYDKILNSLLVNNTWKEIPVISTAFTSGTYFIIFMFLLGISILRKNKKIFIPLSIVIGLYITLLLSPVALFRYCFPIIMLAPVFISFILVPSKKKS